MVFQSRIQKEAQEAAALARNHIATHDGQAWSWTKDGLPDGSNSAAEDEDEIPEVGPDQLREKKTPLKELVSCPIIVVGHDRWSYCVRVFFPRYRKRGATAAAALAAGPVKHDLPAHAERWYAAVCHAGWGPI